MSRPPEPDEKKDYVTPLCLLGGGLFFILMGITGTVDTEHPEMGYVVVVLLGLAAAGWGIHLLCRQYRQPRQRPSRFK